MNIFSFLQSGLSAIVPFIILLGILIFVHELGHFLVARWCGVRCEVFSLGFGKKLLTYKRGDTTYAISAIPLGGYVKMFGEANSEVSLTEEEKKVSFTHKNVWQRIAIVLAGPLMNFFFAILIFFVVALIGEDVRKPVIGDVLTDSPAYQSGFRSGDTLLTINSQRITSWEDVRNILETDKSSEQNLQFEISRETDGEIVPIQFTAKTVENPNVLSSKEFSADLTGVLPYSKGTSVGVLPESLGEQLGLKSGDILTKINNVEIKYWRHLNETLVKAGQGPFTIHAQRLSSDEKPQDITIQIPAKDGAHYSLESLGLESSELYLGKVMEKSPAMTAGLKTGDRLLSINGTDLQKWDDVLGNIKSFNGKDPVQIKVRRDHEVLDLAIVPEMSSQMTASGAEEKRYMIGISPFMNIAAPETFVMKTSNLGKALARGTEKTWDVTVMTAMSFVRLFQAKISPKNIGGVISIGQAASETFKVGMSQFLQMMAIISVNLFILNLLPVPVLDGGHLVFYIIEVVKGAPLSMKKMEYAQRVGMFLLLFLMVFALFNDFTRVLGL